MLRFFSLNAVPAFVGAVTNESASVTVRMSIPASDVQLRVISNTDDITTSPTSTDVDRCVRLDVTGLQTDTLYIYEILSSGLIHSSGQFRTHPAAPGTPSSFTVAFSGDADTGANGDAFQAILNFNPLMFIHLGDMHYQDISTNSPALFHAAYDTVMRCSRQAALYGNVPLAYVWDDHDFGANNSDSTSPSKPAIAAVYRQRIPHYTLPHPTAVYQTWDIGRVRFIMTDQRSEASVETDPDNASKSILGTTQKTWFKNLISNSPGMLLVWLCPRWFANANDVDSWNNFSTERAEICDYIKANAHGRVIVISADKHSLGIDDGSHVDFATGGGEPLPTFQASPLDRAPTALSGTYSNGEFNNNGQWGTMQITDTGDSSISVLWVGRNYNGNTLNSLSFTVTIA